MFSNLLLYQVRGIEAITTYDPNTGEFIINTPCESAQKYWIGGAARVWIFSFLFFYHFAVPFFDVYVFSLAVALPL